MSREYGLRGTDVVIRLPPVGACIDLRAATRESVLKRGDTGPAKTPRFCGASVVALVKARAMLRR